MAKARWQSLRESSSSIHSAASSTSRGSAETTGRGVGEAAVIEAFKCNTKYSRNKSTLDSKPILSEIVVPTAEVVGETSIDSTNHSGEMDDSVDGSGRSTGSGHEDFKMNCMNSATMRQESYYLRGAVDEDRDRQMLQNIADCIPGDVTMSVFRPSLSRHGMDYGHLACPMCNYKDRNLCTFTAQNSCHVMPCPINTPCCNVFYIRSVYRGRCCHGGDSNPR